MYYGNCYDNCYAAPFNYGCNTGCGAGFEGGCGGGGFTFIIPVVLFILLVVCFAGDRGDHCDCDCDRRHR